MTADQYEIRVKTSPGFEWPDRFEDVEILPAGGSDFILHAFIPDDPALHGLLERIRSAGLTLVSVAPVPAGPRP